MKRRMDREEQFIRDYAIRVSWIGVMMALFVHAFYMYQVHQQRSFSEIALVIQVAIYLLANVVKSWRLSKTNEAVKRNLWTSVFGLVVILFASYFIFNV